MLTAADARSGEDQHPLWTRDGKRIIFSSNTAAASSIFGGKAADGTGEPEQLTKSSRRNLPPESRRTEPP
jgi:Tol biopolymer transport system component